MSSPRTRFLHLQFARLYLIIIGLLSLFLLILSTVSWLHQWQVAKSFSQKDLSLDGERLAIELERRTWQLAQQCLNDPELQGLISRPPGPSSPWSVQQDQLQKALSKYQIAGYFLVMQDGVIRFPRMTAPARRPPFAPGGSPIEGQFASIFQTAEADAARGAYHAAIAGYERCGGLPVPDALKAEALCRIAACYAATKNPTDAVKSYDRLGTLYGDYLDDTWQPYAVISGLEVDRIVQNRAATVERLTDLYRDLIRGRWQLSADVVGQLKTTLERRLGTNVPPQERSRFLEQLRIAPLIASELQKEPWVSSYGILTRAVTRTDPNMQICGVRLRDKDRRSQILAFTVDLDWVGGPLLTECRNDLAAEGGPIPEFQIRRRSSSEASNPDLAFRTIFPFLELYLPPAAAEATRTAIRVELWLAGGTVVLMASLLSVIMILVLRVNREMFMVYTREDFLSNVSHELKTPLTLILLYAETLLLDKGLSEQERHYSYEVISREGERLKHLISNLLRLSKAERGKQDYRISEGDLAALVERTAHVCASWFSHLGLEARIDIAPELPPVRFDAELVAQALMNLLDNARKYSRESKVVDIRLFPEGSSIILEVQDYGRGIPDGERERIFEKFYRARNAGAESGSGLGLFLVRDIMRIHNGRVELESEIGRGSRFRLVFPACGVAAEECRV